MIHEQFCQWEDLDIYPVEKSGHDNRTFHLGETMSIRLPSGESYASQVAKENKWLPYLQAHLDYPISKPIAIGKPTEYYPFPWSINEWLKGKTLFECTDIDLKIFARELSTVLQKLQAVDCSDGPKGGLQNFYRGNDLKVYHQQTMDALESLKDELPVDRLYQIWLQCIKTPYKGKDVWVHGDIAPGNILLKDNHFYALIDFGVLGTGDPSCDYAMAWTYFDKESRPVFLEGLSEDMIDRARGWALWKALITYHDKNPDFKKNTHFTIEAILSE